MKLIKLTLENIGPYKGTHIIDFNELNNSLFLITGPTGAGKSYIFDSICYALYSKTSGGKRETDDLKSKYATLDDTASVELEFEYQGKKYKIRREPKQIKRMKRKSSSSSNAKKYDEVSALTMPDGRVVEKDVNAKIKEIIGLDYNQFKMTMMIAQGDFYSLINAGTKEREAIFRKILNTENLNKFTEKLKELLDNKNKEVSIIKSAIDSLLSKFDFDNETKQILVNPNGHLPTKIDLIEEKLGILEKELNEEKKNLDILNNNMLEANNKYVKASSDNDNFNIYQKEMNNNEKLLLDKPAFDSKKNKYDFALKANKVLLINTDYEKEMKRNNILRDSINNLDKEIKELKESKDKLAPKIEKRNEFAALNETIVIKLNELDSNLKEIDKYNELKSNKANLDDNIKKLNYKKNIVLESNAKLQNDISELSIIVNTEPKYKELENVNIQINNIDSEIVNLNNKKNIIDSYLNDILKYKKLSEEYENILKDYNKANDDSNHYEKAFFDSIAGIIAKDLKEGEPCPVCGNVHHVKKAILKEELSENKKKELKDIVDELSLEVNNLKNECGKLSTGILNKKEYISELIKTDFNENNVLLIYEKIVSEKKIEKEPLIRKRDELVEENKKIESAKSKLDEVYKELEVKNKELEEIKQCIYTEENKLAGIDSLLNSMSLYEGIDKLVVESQINSYKAEKNKNDEYIKEVDSTIVEIDRLLEGKKALVEHNIKELEKSDNEISNIKAKLNDSLKENGFDNIECANANSLLDDEIKLLNEEINEYNINLKSSNDKLKDYKEKNYDKLVYQDLSSLEEEKNKSSFIYNEANDKYSNNYSNYNMNKKSFDEVTKLSKESTKILSEYNEIESLYNVASGKISGNRVSFEVYYQLQIFEEILKFASYKFNKMTDGRYELLRGAPKGGNGQIGLEIDVRDLYNGEVRPVSGLSGGESFQASMSLALAFSEIIQMKAGGVELNSMFIDEGFGTLDNEMLDNTKKTLLEIGESTNRKIGIISHITELERSIPSKIIVTKSDKGSSFVIKNE